MENNKYYIKHKRQNLADFQNDIHRFKFWYDGEKECYCVSGLNVFFNDNDNIPDDVKINVSEAILNLIDKNESKWSVPKGAYRIVGDYCAEEFC